MSAAVDIAKRAAAQAAVAEVRPGMLVGLGTGSTAKFAVETLGEQVRAGLAIRTVATSHATEALARAAGIEVVPFATVDRVDLTIDGVDEIDPMLRAIKGAGGALLREKIVAAASDRMIAVADASKSVSRLGRGSVPVEVLPFARSWAMRALAEAGGDPALRTGADGQPVLSDQASLLIDVAFGSIADPDALAARLDAIPGLLGHGLFLREIDTLYLAGDERVERRDRPK